MTCGRKATGLKQKISLDNNKIKEMYVGGMSLTKIAKLLGVSFSTINNRLKEMGVERRNNQN
jgi:transposase